MWVASNVIYVYFFIRLTSTNQVFPVILSLSANDTRLNNRKRPYEVSIYLTITCIYDFFF